MVRIITCYFPIRSPGVLALQACGSQSGRGDLRWPVSGSEQRYSPHCDHPPQHLQSGKGDFELYCTARTRGGDGGVRRYAIALLLSFRLPMLVSRAPGRRVVAPSQPMVLHIAYVVALTFLSSGKTRGSKFRPSCLRAGGRVGVNQIR